MEKKNPAYMTHLQQLMYMWEEFIDFLENTEEVTDDDFIHYVWVNKYFCWAYARLDTTKDCLKCLIYEHELCYKDTTNEDYFITKIRNACKNNDPKKALKLSRIFRRNVGLIYPGWAETTVSLVTDMRTCPVTYGVTVCNGRIL